MRVAASLPLSVSCLQPLSGLGKQAVEEEASSKRARARFVCDGLQPEGPASQEAATLIIV